MISRITKFFTTPLLITEQVLEDWLRLIGGAVD
jgi:hypothetical protein